MSLERDVRGIIFNVVGASGTFSSPDALCDDLSLEEDLFADPLDVTEIREALELSYNFESDEVVDGALQTVGDVIGLAQGFRCIVI